MRRKDKKARERDERNKNKWNVITRLKNNINTEQGRCFKYKLKRS